jgi:SAM-dependent methyltransferase
MSTTVAKPSASTELDSASIGHEMVYPRVRIKGGAIMGRARLAARWARHSIRSAKQGSWDFVGNAIRAEGALAACTLADSLLPSRRVECNICSWRGRKFYPNTGPGYDERNTLCPGCRGLNRHRALLALLVRRTSFFAPGNRIIEVAPMRGFQALCLAQGDLDYTSFDLERFALERGDITKMKYPNDSVDYFVCFHVMEHIPDEKAALSEIRRILKPGGTCVLQVPLDWSVAKTYEYERPDPREVGHVRRYGKDFAQHVAEHGFTVTSMRASEQFDPDVIKRFGLSDEPVFFARHD